MKLRIAENGLQGWRKNRVKRGEHEGRQTMAEEAKKLCAQRAQRKSRRTNEMHGTPQGYLSCVESGWTAASVAVKRRSRGARDLNAVMPIRAMCETMRRGMIAECENM